MRNEIQSGADAKHVNFSQWATKEERRADGVYTVGEAQQYLRSIREDKHTGRKTANDGSKARKAKPSDIKVVYSGDIDKI